MLLIFNFYCLLFLAGHAVQSKTIDNGVLDTPVIGCLNDSMVMRLRTQNSFKGRVFVKGQSNVPQCTFDFREVSTSKDELNIKLRFSDCNTGRSRSLDPNGITYSNTVIVQFHSTFVTSVDKAYHINCFYREENSIVKYALDVQGISPRPILHDMPAPSCSYTVRLESPNGPIVKNAKVGDVVYHKWECKEDQDLYGMLVHSCFVENGQGDKSKVVDINGCAVDQVLLPDLTYSTDTTLAYTSTAVFKYPDHAFIHFKCKVQLCTKTNGGCTGNTPPKCLETKSRRRRNTTLRNGIESPGELDVASEKMLVLDVDDDSLKVGHSEDIKACPIKEQFCLGKRSGVLITGLFAITAACVLFLAYRFHQKNQQTPKEIDTQ